MVVSSIASGKRGARITKCKGYKKSRGEELSFKDFETMARGGEKTQKQVQFLCPKMNHLSVDEKFSMRTPKVTKKFRFLYNKGVVRPATEQHEICRMARLESYKTWNQISLHLWNSLATAECFH